MQKVIKAMGLVFGDIGTSPIYTLPVIFLFLPPTKENVFGVLSLIFWTLIIIPTVQYTVLAMSLSLRGEGGTLILSEILRSLLKSRKRLLGVVTFLSFIGISLLMGDGVITPAISIMSAVEGISYIPGLRPLEQMEVVLLSVLIAFGLFYFQKRGTEKVSGSFGPIMSLWFLSLFTLGFLQILSRPEVILALNPLYAIEFFQQNGWKSYLILGEVILCATGSEAMYADMGHLGARPIKRAWYLVLTALVVNYFGQGAFLLNHPEAKSILFEMCLNTFAPSYVPFLILALMATVIASQAMISGMFSVVYQAMFARYLPIMKVKYTSPELHSQIYIGSINWLLFLAVIFIMFEFKSSSSLAAAYGLAVTGDMTITGLFLITIFYLKKRYAYLSFAILTTFTTFLYFISTLFKLPYGGYWALVLAGIPFTIIILYTQGQKKLYHSLTFLSREEFVKQFSKFYKENPKISGKALYFIRDPYSFPPYVIENIFVHGIVYEENIFVSLIRKNEPYGITTSFLEEICPGAKLFEIAYGYMEILKVEDILREQGIDERVIFYGLEDIETQHPIWKIYSFIKQISPHFVKFLNLPPAKLHGVLTRIEL
ncbi:KUP/HAK/KT family potassium transporter [Thermodesulfobacterium sp. TA1]|uniref:KUP/HAK/KT family potassium transporter n=1 Tax=Thermodesulfobacterium sp. TA1 TaxID=2234087 RepID=UPI001231F3B2|nr:KUP/HAK/KT family potassium transporter [Thermodesulfobacterium sp. TA1]QER42587.1 KUP/HAK/KT family potassium transporter [Thermodesulfobacterium sp. TA1]